MTMDEDGVEDDHGVAASELSDLDDEEEAVGEGDEDESDEEEEQDEEDEESCTSKPATSVHKSPTTATGFLHEENNLELEIRRSRAMSTGSQCSW